jgi:hypothetical protein
MEYDGVSSSEQLFFEFSTAPAAMDTPGGVVAAETPEAAEWKRLFERCWGEISAYTTAADPAEAATRAVLSGLSVAQLKEKTPTEIATISGMRLPDACICLLAVGWEASDGGGAGPPTLEHLPQSLPGASNYVKYLRPHSIVNPNDSCKYVAIRSGGAVGAAAIEMSYHSAVSFVISIIFLSNLVDEGKEIVSGYDSNHIPIIAEIRFGFFLAVALLRYFVLMHSVIALIYTGSAQMSEYHACHYLSLPWAIRFASAPMLVLSIFLNNITNMLAFWELRDSWMLYGYGAFVALLVSIGMFYALVMFLRATTAHRPPQRQWCRWFPYGTSFMAREMNGILEAAGCKRRREMHEAWRSSVTDALAQSILFPKSSSSDAPPPPPAPPALPSPSPPPPVTTARPSQPVVGPRRSFNVAITPPPPPVTQRSTIRISGDEVQKPLPHQVQMEFDEMKEEYHATAAAAARTDDHQQPLPLPPLLYQQRKKRHSPRQQQPPRMHRSSSDSSEKGCCSDVVVAAARDGGDHDRHQKSSTPRTHHHPARHHRHQSPPRPPSA